VTTPQSVFAASAIILIDLFARAVLDKVLAAVGSPETIALWAQLQSVVELVGGVSVAGVLAGLTVMMAQVRNPSDEPVLLRYALGLTFITSLSAALVLALISPILSGWLTPEKISPPLFLAAAAMGCITLFPATLNAYWLGKHQQQKMLRLALLTSLVLFIVASCAWLKLPFGELLVVQTFSMAIIGLATGIYLRKLLSSGGAPKHHPEYLRKLRKFVTVGLAIGIMSPVSMLLIRGVLSQTLSWNEAGIMQAMWRSTDWITASAAGVLSLVFFPRFSNTFGSTQFDSELKRAGLWVLLPTAALLFAVYLNENAVLAALYDTRFAVNNATAAWFMLSCWVRVVSWVLLFGLYAAHCTKPIIVGELLSLPLYVLLLWLFKEGMTLERAAMLCCASYMVYLVFNAAALLNSAARYHSNLGGKRPIPWYDVRRKQ
jgi:PST family polysaccharide transporter